MTHLSLGMLSCEDGFIPLRLTPDGVVESSAASRIPDDPGKWVVIAAPGVLLHPGLKDIVRHETQHRPDVDVFYGDEVAPVRGRVAPEIILKPGLDITLLAAYDYIGMPLIVRASVAHRLGGLLPAAKTAACYELVLNAISAGHGIERITEVLAAHTDARPRPTLEDLRAALQRRYPVDLFEISEGLAPGTLRLQRRFRTFPEVTLVIPTRQGTRTDIPGLSSDRPMIIHLLDSISRTKWPMENLNVLVGDALEDGSIYEGRCWPFRFKRIVAGSRCNRQFNYAEKINKLWRAAESEHLVLMNDDVDITTPEWLQALLTFSMQDDVGVVGARLLYANGSVQHAGIPGGLFDMCAHAWLGQPANAPTYQNWGLVHREWSMVTGAVVATRKSVLESVNGFDERFRLEFNDVDLCLRLRMLGYRNVYTPFAELIHYEKASRGELLPRGSELALF